jgi:hypothetical protein
MIDPLPQLFVDAVTYSEPNPQKQRELHLRDLSTRWFTIHTSPSSGGFARLQVTDRFRELCDPGISGNRWSLHQYPSFVSFIGDTCVGKSTLLRAMLLMGILDPSGSDSNGVQKTVTSREGTMEKLKKIIAERSFGPVTRSADYQRLTDPTTFGVHLYKDNDTSSEQDKQVDSNVARSFPILIADCEGFRAGNAITNSERARSAGDSTQQTDVNIEHAVPEMIPNNVISDEPITASSYRISGKDGIELFYARFLYTISDAVVFVTKDDTTLQAEMHRVLEWAASAVFKSVNQSARRTLIIVRNMAGFHDSHLYDKDVLKSSLLGNLKPLWAGSTILAKFRQDYNKSQPNYNMRIHDNRDLFQLFFQDICVCYIPDKIRAEHEEVFRQYQDLRRMIVSACHESQTRKARNLMQHNVPTLTHILQRAFEHFRTSNLPFDFYDAARKDNPNPVSMADHITNFLRHYHESPEAADAPDGFLSQVVSISLVSWALRTFKRRYHRPFECESY